MYLVPRFFSPVAAVFVIPFFVARASSAVDGFAQGVTGGADGNVITVTTASDLKKYAESSAGCIIRVSGAIDLESVGGRIDIKPNKTIIGRDPNAVITGNLALDNDYPVSNVIIRNLNITNPGGLGSGDGITITAVSKIFITNCTLYDCKDGCIDITGRADYITVSWCKFYYTDSNDSHRFVNLIGAGDRAVDDMNRFHVTLHHNWWSSLCSERMPSVRFGKVHIYNNYYSCSGNNYCIRARLHSQCLIENNYFEDVDDPYYVLLTSGENGKIQASGNFFKSCTGRIDLGTDTVFKPPYPYTLDKAADLPRIIMTRAGNIQF
jgi:pectate lyase